MPDTLDIDDAAATPSGDNAPPSAAAPAVDTMLWRVLAIVGIAALSAGIAYAVVRATGRRGPADPTSERIQSLIDEANRLLKTLDDQKRA